MPFPSTGALTTFVANTKAKSAEVNANFSALIGYLNTTTTDILVGSVWEKIAATAASHTLTASDSIRALLINVNTSAGYTVTLPTAAASAYRKLTLKNIGLTTGALTVDPAGSELLDGTTASMLLPVGCAVDIHSDGTSWYATKKYEKLSIKAVTDTHTLSVGDGVETLLVSTGAQNRTITLPAAASSNGRVITIKKTDTGSGAVILDGSGAETIDGHTQLTFSHANNTATVRCDGTAWYLVNLPRAGVLAQIDSYTITDSDGARTILMTTGATDRTVTLPTAADNAGRTLTIKKVDSGAGTVTLDGEGAETIDGATTAVITNQYAAMTVVCDGTSWHII